MNYLSKPITGLINKTDNLFQDGSYFNQQRLSADGLLWLIQRIFSKFMLLFLNSYQQTVTAFPQPLLLKQHFISSPAGEWWIKHRRNNKYPPRGEVNKLIVNFHNRKSTFSFPPEILRQLIVIPDNPKSRAFAIAGLRSPCYFWGSWLTQDGAPGSSNVLNKPSWIFFLILWMP
jgi:hypothetical protein